jgi:hypothetical protein
MCGAEGAPLARGAAVVLSGPPAGRLQAVECQRPALLSQEVLAQKAALEAGNKELQDKYNQKAMWVWQGITPQVSACIAAEIHLLNARHPRRELSPEGLCLGMLQVYTTCPLQAGQEAEGGLCPASAGERAAAPSDRHGWRPCQRHGCGHEWWRAPCQPRGHAGHGRRPAHAPCHSHGAQVGLARAWCCGC